MYQKTTPTLLIEYFAIAINKAREELNALMKSQEQLRDFQNNPHFKICPFCGGRMLYIAPLGKLKLSNDNNVPFNVPNFRYDWECQNCFVGTAERIKPSDSFTKWKTIDHWERATTPLKGGSIPVKMFRKYSRLKAIVRESHGQKRIWYLKADDGLWYRFEGAGKQVMEEQLPDPE